MEAEIGLEPILYELMRLVSLPLDYSAIVEPLIGLEPLTFWLTARRSTIELPRNTTPLHMVGIEPTVYSLQELFYL